MSKIDEIKSRWAAITEGKWEAVPASGVDPELFLGVEREYQNFEVIASFGNASSGEHAYEKDATAIAAAPEDIRWLVERVERQARELEVLRALDEQARTVYNSATLSEDFGPYTVAHSDLEALAQRIRAVINVRDEESHRIETANER